MRLQPGPAKLEVLSCADFPKRYRVVRPWLVLRHHLPRRELTFHPRDIPNRYLAEQRMKLIWVLSASLPILTLGTELL